MISVPDIKKSPQEFVAVLCDDAIAIEDRATALSMVNTADVTGEMLASMAAYLLEQAVPLKIDGMDVCGTGGDKGLNCVKTFNVSTASAFVLAGGDVPVVKHGNRAVTSQSGSSDVLAAMGVPVCTTEVEAKSMHARHGICFIAAPSFHPVLKNVAPVRKALGKPTFFNLLGPLCNPARALKQVIGVFDDVYMRAMIEAAQALGKTDVMIVHGEDGLDEISLCAPTKIISLRGSEISEWTVAPEDMGLSYVLPENIEGGTPEDNALIIRAMFCGGTGASSDLVAANAAAGFVLAGRAEDLKEGVEVAKGVLKSGLALNKLDDMKVKIAA